MKYKRKKYLSPTCDKSYPKEKSPKRFFPDLRRKSVIAGCFVTALFLLVQYDVIDRGILDTIVSSPYKFRESKQEPLFRKSESLPGSFALVTSETAIIPKILFLQIKAVNRKSLLNPCR